MGICCKIFSEDGDKAMKLEIETFQLLFSGFFFDRILHMNEFK